MHIARMMFSFLAITGALFGSDLRMPLIHPQLRFNLPEECRMCDESSPANGARYGSRPRGHALTLDKSGVPKGPKNRGKPIRTFVV